MKHFFTLILIMSLGVGYSQTQFIAHRGASYLAPENTVASAKLAWELGADAVEVDIHLSKDNRVMVIHDNTTKRTCQGKNLEIKTSPSLLLRDLDAGSFKAEQFKGEKIPFLSDMISLIPEGKKLVVEIKCGTEVIPQLKRILEKTGKSGQIVFISFDWKTIIETKNEFPGNTCYWLSATNLGLKKKMEEAAQVGLQGVNLKSSLIDEKLMDLAKQLKLDVLAWTVDDPDEAKRVIDLGVTQITTNRPKWLKEELSKSQN
jgi:glycerophosphoryl diester phosphodiesterase